MQKSITIVVMVLATVLLSCNGQAPTFRKMYVFETITNFMDNMVALKYIF